MAWHPAAALLPLMGDAELRELADDIRANGLRTPIVLLGGAILDGRNRHRACGLAGVEPRFEYADTRVIGDPFLYVASLNLHRRHLSESQRAMVGAKLKEHFAAQARERMLAGKALEPSPKFGGGSGGEAADEAAALVNVSRGSVESAARVLAKGVPELVEAVERGEVAVSAAAEVSRMPVDAQRKAVATKSVPAAAKAARAARKAAPPSVVPVDDDDDLDPGELDESQLEITVVDARPHAPEVERPIDPAMFTREEMDEQAVELDYNGSAIAFREHLAALLAKHPPESLKPARRERVYGELHRLLRAVAQALPAATTIEKPAWTPRVLTGGKS